MNLSWGKNSIRTFRDYRTRQRAALRESNRISHEDEHLERSLLTDLLDRTEGDEPDGGPDGGGEPAGGGRTVVELAGRDRSSGGDLGDEIDALEKLLRGSSGTPARDAHDLHTETDPERERA